jgi:hypothetical protein
MPSREGSTLDPGGGQALSGPAGDRRDLAGIALSRRRAAADRGSVDLLAALVVVAVLVAALHADRPGAARRPSGPFRRAAGRYRQAQVRLWERVLADDGWDRPDDGSRPGVTTDTPVQVSAADHGD